MQSSKIVLNDANAEIDPIPTTGGGRNAEPELDCLSNIVKSFNDNWGGIASNDQLPPIPANRSLILVTL